ncbi:MAG: alpha/beta hydrolase [Bacteroidales bacterium]|nr:alpha/beta hydrolase [Bacteroidales bacterium]
MRHVKTFMSFCMSFMLAIPFVSGQVQTIDQIKTEPVTVTTGITFKLNSKAMNEDRIIMIGVPDDYATSNKKYPVLYLLDGQWGFSSTVQTLGWLSNPQYGMIPQTIVVAIHTGENRERDLTPTQNKENNLGGEADKLYQFIKEELIPFVDKNYRTYNYRVIGGASLGGLFVMHTFDSDPQLFNGYLSMSPAMWWDNGVMLDRTKDLLSKNPNLHNRVYLALTNEGTAMGVDSLASILEKYGSKELIWKYDKQQQEVHETVGYKGTWDGMKFLLADWHYPLVDFGTKEQIFVSHDPASHNPDDHKIIKVSDAILEKFSDLYLDSYGRIITLTKVDKTLQFTCNQLPTVILYPETENKFFLKNADVQNNLFLKGYDVEFEFIKDDSLVVTANGKIDFTAKKIKHPPFVKLSDNILDEYIGKYLPTGQNIGFDVSKEGNSMKISTDGLNSNIYPIGENKFYILYKGQMNSSFEIEFIKDEFNKVTKMNISRDGNLVFQSQRIE